MLRFYSQGRNYQPKPVETLCDNFIKLFTFTFQLGAYTSPLIIMFLIRKGTFSPQNGPSDSVRNFIKLITGFVLAAFGAMCVRGIARFKNSDYVNFINALSTVKQASPASDPVKRKFDFDFAFWPVDFKWSESQLAEHGKPPRPLKNSDPKEGAIANKLISISGNFISRFLAHTVARWMVYPGSVGLLQALMAPALLDGRKLLIERQKGKRYKLLAQDGNEIDCIFVDKRDASSSVGKTLVIGCEGNTGFYECGVIVTPIHAGTSQAMFSLNTYLIFLL